VTKTTVDADRLQRAVDLVAAWVEDGVLPGAALVVAHGEQIIAEGYWGNADARAGRPSERDTLWSIASITKPVTAAAFMACVDRGLLKVDGLVAGSLPEFTAEQDDPMHWRSETSFRHLLTHSSGLAGFSRNNLELRKRHAPIDEFISSFLKEELHFPPGRWHLYSSVGFGLLAEAVGRALIASGAAPHGRPLEAYESFTLHMLKEMGVEDAAFRPNEAEQERCDWVEETGQEGLDWEIGNSRYYRSLGMPWGGLFTRARDVLTFIQAFLPSRRAATSRVLSEAAAGEMIRMQAAPPEAPASVASSQRDITWDPTSKPRASVPWGLGWEVKGNQPGDYFGELTHATTFGHYGASGTIAWADPEADLAMVLLTNRAWVSRWPVHERRAARLADAIRSALR
jgi:CubicO group peptidase (beta-lactamase class C family)